MIVFDMAGTTVNENNVVYKTLQKAINEAGFSFTLEQVLAEGAGKEKFQAIRDILKIYAGSTDEQLAGSIYRNFTGLLAKAYEVLDIAPEKGAEELFRALRERNILVVLNTGYNGETARSLLKKLGWREGHEIDGLVTASDTANNRPRPDMILLAQKRFDVKETGEIIKVGDSMTDIEEGKNAGCGLSIGITTGAHTIGQLQEAHPDYIINNLLELLPILDKERC